MSDLDLHYLPVTQLGVSSLQWINILSGMANSIDPSGIKFPQNLLALLVYIFHLDAKNEEKVKKVLKISLALPKVYLQMRAGEWNFIRLDPDQTARLGPS